MTKLSHYCQGKQTMVTMKTMTASRMSQEIFVILYHTLFLSVINYGFWPLTLSATQLNQL